jgi:hypothetical protein
MGPVVVVVVVEVLSMVVELNLVLNLFGLYKLVAESKHSILMVLKVFVVMVDFVWIVA